jgi:hypothetical protein
MSKKLIRLTEHDLHNVITECVQKVLNEGLFGYPDECDQIILSYQHDRESMDAYEAIVRQLLKKKNRGIELDFNVLVNSSVMKHFQQFVFSKFKQYQDTPITRNTPYIFREYVAKRMIEQVNNGEYDNLK